MKKVYKTTLFFVLFISSLCAFAQDEDEVKALGGLQGVLAKIDKNLEDFLKGFTTLNDLKKDEEGQYIEPKLSEEELNEIKEPARSMIHSMEYPPESEPPVYNTILHAGIELSSDALRDTFTILNSDKCPSGIQNCKLRKDIIAGFAQLPISSPYVIGDKKGFITEESYAKAIDKQENPYNQALDLNSLLGPLLYTTTQTSENGTTTPGQDVMALNFIKFITEQSLPVRNNLTLSGDINRDSSLLSRLRGYASHQSVDLSNFYEMLARRIKVSPKGESQLQMEQEMASRRLNSDWHEKMEEASPPVIQRETLYLLAEINYQLYISRIEQERILATLTALHALQLQTTLKTTFAPTEGAGLGTEGAGMITTPPSPTPP